MGSGLSVGFSALPDCVPPQVFPPMRHPRTSVTGPVLCGEMCSSAVGRTHPRPRLDPWGQRCHRPSVSDNAPAGSGKTTLLARWCSAERERRKVAWLSLEEIDDDPVRFWAYVIEAFRMVDAASGEAPLAQLQGSGSADVLTQLVLPQLLNDLAEADGRSSSSSTTCT